jgi:hypothetical protein
VINKKFKGEKWTSNYKFSVGKKKACQPTPWSFFTLVSIYALNYYFDKYKLNFWKIWEIFTEFFEFFLANRTRKTLYRKILIDVFRIFQNFDSYLSKFYFRKLEVKLNFWGDKKKHWVEREIFGKNLCQQWNRST